MARPRWNGVFPAVTTQFNADESLNIPATQKLMERLIQAGVHGFIMLGTVGENCSLRAEEKRKVLSAAKEVVNGRIPILSGVAEFTTAEAAQYAKDAAKIGVDGLMVLPGMVYTSDTRETLHHFRSIAAATGLPIMIYNNPVDYKTEVTLDMFDELQSCRNIQAVKESTRDVTNITRMRNRFGDRYSILCGVDTLAMEELCLGADGWVAGLVCAFPKETVVLYNLIKQGRIEEAAKLYPWFMPLLELDIHPKLVQYIKLAQSVAGLGTEYVRPPRLTINGEERERILKIITDSIANKPMLTD